MSGASLDRPRAIRYVPTMTAAQIIHEIECLPPFEKAKVVRYAKELPVTQPLSGTDLTELAQRMVGATDPVEAQCLKAELVNGFYGDK